MNKLEFGAVGISHTELYNALNRIFRIADYSPRTQASPMKLIFNNDMDKAIPAACSKIILYFHLACEPEYQHDTQLIRQAMINFKLGNGLLGQKGTG